MSTANSIRVFRSVLYVPGANERALTKATALPVDAVILDLEDAVAPQAKGTARERVCVAAGGGGFARSHVVIRVNGIDTPWHEPDLRSAAVSGAYAVLVPKVESVEHVTDIERALTGAGAPDELRVWVMIETPLAVVRAADIAGAGTRMDALVLGTNDLAAELNCRPGPDRGPLLTSLSLFLLAARAHGRVALDGVYNDTTNLDGFTAEVRQARDLGFDGKTLIHPGQIDPCNAAFTPTDDELDHARRVVEAFTEAERNGRGVAIVDGKLIENLHARQARRVIASRETSTH